MNCRFYLGKLPLAIFIGAFGVLSPLFSAESTAEPFDYTDYAEVLMKYVDARGMVNYKGLKDNRENLDGFASALGDLDTAIYNAWDDNSKIAFIINTYNALTLKLIIDHYPIKASFFKRFIWPKNSIRQISGAWDKITFQVMGQNITLDHIEHGILRKQFNEPRIHMALVCASKGCAQLANVPFIGENLDEQLDHYANLFVNNPEKVRIDQEKKVVHLSSYFKWYGQDFVKTYGTDEKFKKFNDAERASLNFISKYLNEEDRTHLINEDYSIKYLKYDWSLNEQKEKK